MRSLTAFLGGAALASLAACAPAPSAGPAGAPPEPMPAAAAPQPKYGGIFSYTASGYAETLHPHKGGGIGERRNVGPIYETLVNFKWEPPGDYRIDQEVEPWLAESWSQPDPTTYVFKIRPGIKWQDGQAFTARDVVFTYQEILNPANAYPMRSRLEGVSEVTAPDDLTVRITRQEPSPAFLAQIADFNMLIMPKHLVERGEDLSKVAVGTGPMKLRGFDRTRSIQHVRNESYWQPGRPYLAGMEMFIGLDVATRDAAFYGKKVDVRAPGTKKQLDDILSRVPDVKYVVMTTDYGLSMLMQQKKPPFNDIRVRRAVHLGVDRHGLLSVADFGNGVINPAGGIGHKAGWSIPQEELFKMPGYRRDSQQDLAEAKRLLAEAGYASGLKFPVIYQTSQQLTPRIIEPMAAQLRAIGVDLVLRGQPTPEYRKAFLSGDYEAAMDFAADMSFKRQLEMVHSTGPLNQFGLSDPKLDALLDAQRTVMDLGRRKQASIEMQRLMEENVYVIPTIDVGAYQAWYPWVHDYWYNIGTSESVEAYNLARLWMDVDLMPADRRAWPGQ